MMMRLIKVAIMLCGVTVLLSTLSLKTTAAKASTSSPFSPNVCGKWSVVPSPNRNGSSGLHGVAAISANDIWAVGSSSSQMGFNQTLIEQWNGTQWSVVTSPNPGPMYNVPYSISAISANNIWVVGTYANDKEVLQTLILHWDGSSWSIVSSPNPSSLYNVLFSVSAVSANDIWAVGDEENATATGSVQQTLIEHWNGSSWSVVSSPNPGSTPVLNGVAAVSSTDVWAVGNIGFNQTLIEHWNGSNWSIVQSPNPGSGDSLQAVAAVSASDIWAVGSTTNSNSIQTLVEQWNGTSWQVVTSPNIGKAPSFIDVTAISTNDVWAVGSYLNKNNVFQPLIEHWNGTQWSIVKGPNSSSNYTQLLGVSAVSANDVWAVGFVNSNTLTENYHC